QCDWITEKAGGAQGLLEYVQDEVDDAYIERVKTLSVRPELLREQGGSLKIVYTPLHGSGNVPVRRVLREVGVTQLLVVPEQEAPDPDFPTVRVPNPEEPDTFRLAIALADREGADAAFATDPDCDRLGVATRGPDGKFVLLTGNQIGCLLLDYILSSRAENGTLPSNGAAVKSIVSTEMARRIASAYGVEMIDTLTGFKFIAEQIQRFEQTGEKTFLFGFEESYGYLSSTFVRDKDAVNASLLVTELALYLKTQGKTLWDRLEALRARYGCSVERVTSVSLPGKDGVARMRGMMESLRREPPRRIADLAVRAVRDYRSGLRTQDGESRPMGLPASDVLYYELEGGSWFCVRPSGTEPKIKLYVNAFADAQPQADALADAIGRAAQELLA
ncbi:MAG: phospho-sugar mutase, partial [Christensenellales bacterium]|nr:phospho-sugar mutase [Christensenellales bacterium]